MTRTNSTLAGYPGHLSFSQSPSQSPSQPPQPEPAHPDFTAAKSPTGASAAEPAGRDVLWFAAEAELGAAADDVAYALRALIASDKTAALETGGKHEAVRILNVEVSADHHETGGGNKTVSALVRVLADAP